MIQFGAVSAEKPLFPVSVLVIHKYHFSDKERHVFGLLISHNHRKPTIFGAFLPYW